MTTTADAGRVRIYPRSVSGKFRRLKYAVLAIAYLVYYGLPWLPWHRATGPDQAVLFDIVGRKYYLFDLVVQPQQIFWLAGFLVLAAMLLFFVTGIAGRVFCGFFCFQTLWTDLFMRIEYWVQGERPARIRLDQQPWGPEKLRKKGLTWLLWFLVAFWTAITFTLYWGEAGTLLREFFTGTAPAAMYITTGILTFTTFTMAGLAREQVCTHMCPYSRFQAAMFDKDTKLVTYDLRRGEGEQGRSKVRKGLKTLEERHAAGVGDCIDCGYCVQVCPTGIDIRNGLQVQCIHCGLCIDACNTIMDNMGWPRGLIRFSSAREQVCTHMCPYSRFQAAMFDKDTKLVTYDLRRGEGEQGRSKVRKGLKTLEERHAAGVGDCIDCGYCVQVCPTGIDIRNGLQVQCIHCGLCIDACNTIMDNMGWPRGLIRFSSAREQEGGKARLFKLKTVGYGLSILVVTVLLFWSVSHQGEIDTAVRQIRQPLYVLLSDGSIQNSYQIKLSNLTSETHHYSLRIKDLPGAQLDVGHFRTVELKPLKHLTLLVKVRTPQPPPGAARIQDFEFEVVNRDTGAVAAIVPARFYRP